MKKIKSRVLADTVLDFALLVQLHLNDFNVWSLPPAIYKKKIHFVTDSDDTAEPVFLLGIISMLLRRPEFSVLQPLMTAKLGAVPFAFTDDVSLDMTVIDGWDRAYRNNKDHIDAQCRIVDALLWATDNRNE